MAISFQEFHREPPGYHRRARAIYPKTPSELLLLLRWFRAVRHADVTVRPWAKTNVEWKPNQNSWKSQGDIPPNFATVFAREIRPFF